MRYHYLRDRVTIVWSLWRHQQQLWRHQQNENRASETGGRCINVVGFIVIYGFVMSCKKLNDVCTIVTNCFGAHSRVIFVFISIVAAQIGKWTPKEPSRDHWWNPRTKASDAELWCLLCCAWINGRVNNHEAGDSRRHRPHYDVTVMDCVTADTTTAAHQVWICAYIIGFIVLAI